MKKLALLVLAFMSLAIFAQTAKTKPLKFIRQKGASQIYSTAEVTSTKELKAMGVNLEGLLDPNDAKADITYSKVILLIGKKYDHAALVVLVSFVGEEPIYQLTIPSTGDVQYDKKSGAISFTVSDSGSSPLVVKGTIDRKGKTAVFNIQDTVLSTPFASNTRFTLVQD